EIEEEVLKFASRGKRISVPASSANLGPGFDALGLALGLYNTCEFKKTSDKDLFEKNLKDNLIYKAYKYAFDFYEKEIIPVEFDVNTNIFLSRGLGSSAACIVMGIMAAFSVMDKEFDKKEILKIATEIEGHPDNVSPAIFGNASAAILKKQEVFVEKFEISNNFKFLAIIPDFKLPTKLAREALPQTYTKEDAVFNISRVSMLILSLISGNEENLKTALEDKIHEPYRLKLIPEIDEIEKIIADSPAIGHYLSGAGSTIMVILKSSDRKSEKLIKSKLEKLSASYKVMPVEIDKRGAFLI
ncbi:homoserine kinase, partial [Peptoniphilus timonensis]|uniref:homoserine kinase n=1 Tax=Peptoniphilus timonensis TaxID=1268254 RepID=UPI0009DAEE06